MKKVSTLAIIILILFFSCGNKEQVKVSEQEEPPQAVTAKTPTPPTTLADIAKLPPSERTPQDRIAVNVSDLITFGNDNRDSASTTEDNYTIQGQVIPSATRLGVLYENRNIFSQDFSGTEAPHLFSVHLTKAANQMKQGRNEYIFRMYKDADYIDRTFVLDVLSRPAADIK